MLKLVINAIPIAPGGGLSVLLGLLEGWRRINAAIDPVVLVGKSATLGILRKAVPGVRVEPVLLDQAPSKQLLWQLTRLGPWLGRMRPGALLTNNPYVHSPGAVADEPREHSPGLSLLPNVDALLYRRE